MMFTGLETTRGATPAAMKTANANGTTRRGSAGYRVWMNAITSGVSRSTAASLLSTDAVARLTANTAEKSDRRDHSPRLNRVRARQSMAPTRPAAAVVSMIERIVTSGRHSVSAVSATSRRRTVPAESSSNAPATAAVAGPT